MKRLGNVFNWTNLVKVLVIFTLGFITRILIYHYLDVNVFTEYTNSISILYYFSLSSLSIYFDQLFPHQYCAPINVEPINNIIKYFDDNSKGYLLFNKDSTVKLPLHHKIRCKLSWYSLGKGKNAFATYQEYKLTWDPHSSLWIEIKNLVKWSVHWIDNKPSGNTDPRWVEVAEERRRRLDNSRWEGRKNYAHEYKKNK